jgi:hypothetical protein
MKTPYTGLWVPTASFGLAIALAFLAGSPISSAMRMRAPGEQTGNLDVGIVSLDCKAELEANFKIEAGNTGKCVVKDIKLCYEVCPCSGVSTTMSAMVKVDLHLECTNSEGKKEPREVKDLLINMGGNNLSHSGEPGASVKAQFCPDHPEDTITVTGGTAALQVGAFIASFLAQEEFEGCDLKKRPNLSNGFTFALTAQVKCSDDASKTDVGSATTQIAAGELQGKPVTKNPSFKGKGCKK